MTDPVIRFKNRPFATPIQVVRGDTIDINRRVQVGDRVVLYIEGVDESEGELRVSIRSLASNGDASGSVYVSASTGNPLLDTRLKKATVVEFHVDEVFRWGS